MKSTHKQYKCLIGLQEIELNPGQFVFGRKKCSIETGLSEQIVRSCLLSLKSTNNLTIKTTNKFSIISITNWDSYQVDECEFNQQITSKPTNNQPTNNQQITTYKNIKNIKNIKEDIGPTKKRRHQLPQEFILSENLVQFAKKNGINGNRIKEVFEHFCDYHRSRGNTMLDWDRAFMTWVRNDKKFGPKKFDLVQEQASYTPPNRIEELRKKAIEREKYLKGEI